MRIVTSVLDSVVGTTGQVQAGKQDFSPQKRNMCLKFPKALSSDIFKELKKKVCSFDNTKDFYVALV